MPATVIDDDDTITTHGSTMTSWLTLDEVAKRMRFPTRRALLAHLRRHPAPVFQRIGSQRYFMRAQDVDRMMAPVDLVRPPKSEPGEVIADDAGFVEVSPSAARTPARAGAAKRTRPSSRRRAS